ncbi:hypothetical protein QYE76_042417 [Lolium multiflorum]|uniref:Integrase zinc-binding domain-containing protein n=1 Tax=Lolium multiflorum TaxID=4521 RepID=A0AAD8TGX1_LOLMU|nr:hypothetical protein QYE76_042417 [Lolium multiflorum]
MALLLFPLVRIPPPRYRLLSNDSWTQPFLDYLIDRKLPEDEVHARQIIRRARSYTIVDGQLYKQSANGVFLKCVSSQDGIEILREIHAGDCGHHAAPRSLVAKAFRLGFYWLTAKEDAEKLVKTCRGCQYYATQPNAPAQELKTIPITWPFAVWGLDMVGKLKKSSPGGHEYLLVAIDKFSKWIEAKPVNRIYSVLPGIRIEAVLTDIIHDSPRVSAYDEETADEARHLSLDLIEEARNLADQRSTIYQQKL